MNSLTPIHTITTPNSTLPPSISSNPMLLPVPPHTLSIQLPPRPHLHTWNRHLPASKQFECPGIPIFKDACYIREQVFVNEQQVVPLLHHLDNDDARSVHFVVYAPAEAMPGGIAGENGQGNYVPVGTVRLLPYPDHARPLPDSRIEAPLAPSTDAETEPEAQTEAKPDLPPSSTFFFQPSPPYEISTPSTLHDGIEPYIRLGRLAIIPSYRKQGFADVLIQAALKWASEHPRFSCDMLREEERERVPEWRGLVCLYAREEAVGTWGRNGFVVDEGMGRWWEVGIRHLGMVGRVRVGVGGERKEK